MSQKQFSLATKTVTKDVLVKPNIVSDAPHFNGQRFFNPWEREERNQGALLKWILTRDNRTWPENLTNQHFAKPMAHFSDNVADWKMWFVGHATVLLQIGRYNFLTDPVWAERCSPFKY
ncbi:MAG TPA: Zn-dependent hydrolase, partial [Agitococcus sp.]|nr:Zn-dependent hydrolase [Agitococcus sp.]